MKESDEDLGAAMNGGGGGRRTGFGAEDEPESENRETGDSALQNGVCDTWDGATVNCFQGTAAGGRINGSGTCAESSSAGDTDANQLGWREKMLGVNRLRQILTRRSLPPAEQWRKLKNLLLKNTVTRREQQDQ